MKTVTLRRAVPSNLVPAGHHEASGSIDLGSRVSGTVCNEDNVVVEDGEQCRQSKAILPTADGPPMPFSPFFPSFQPSTLTLPTTYSLGHQQLA